MIKQRAHRVRGLRVGVCLALSLLTRCTAHPDADPDLRAYDSRGHVIEKILQPRRPGTGPTELRVSLSHLAQCQTAECQTGATLGLRHITHVLIDVGRKDIALVGGDDGLAGEIPLDSLIEMLKIAKSWSRLGAGDGALRLARPWQTLSPPDDDPDIFKNYVLHFEPRELYDSSAGLVLLNADIVLKYLILKGFRSVPPLAAIERQHVMACDVLDEYEAMHGVMHDVNAVINYYFADHLVRANRPTIEWRFDGATSTWSGTINTDLELRHGKGFGSEGRAADDFVHAMNSEHDALLHELPILQDAKNTLQLWNIAAQLARWSQFTPGDTFVDDIIEHLMSRYHGGYVTQRTVATWAESKDYGRQCRLQRHVDGQNTYVEIVTGRSPAVGGFSLANQADAIFALQQTRAAGVDAQNAVPTPRRPRHADISLMGQWTVSDTSPEACPGSISIEPADAPSQYRGTAKFACAKANVSEEFEISAAEIPIRFHGTKVSDDRYALDTYLLDPDAAGAKLQGLSTDNESMPSSVTLTRQ